MELKRILAKDSRTAMDIANQRYGKDVLVVSSQSVGGQVELVVALDVAPAPAAAAPAGASSAFTQAFRQALGPMPEADRRGEPLLDKPVMTAAQAFSVTFSRRNSAARMVTKIGEVKNSATASAIGRAGKAR